MTIKFIYSDNSQLSILEKVKSLYKDRNIKFEGFDFNIYKDKKKAYKVLGACSARLIPFCSIYNDNNELIKAFYSEVSECTENNIIKYLDNYIKLNKNNG